MKTKTLIIPAIALATLASCGGGTTTQNANEKGATTDGANTVATTPTDTTNKGGAPTVSTPEPTANTVELNELTLKILKEKLKVEGVTVDKITNSSKGVFNNKEYEDEWFKFFKHDDGNFSSYWYNYFYPKKDGGYVVITVETNAGGDAYEPTYEFHFYDCKDGKISDNTTLLKPTANDFYANFADFPKATAEAINEAISEHPRYNVVDSKKVEVTFSPWYLEGDDPYDAELVLPKPLKGFDNKKGEIFPKITYIWDGEQFVRDPEYKPLQEDAKYLKGEPADDSNIALKIFKMKYPSMKKPEPNSKYSCSAFEEGCEGCYNSESVYCFPMKNGGYLVAEMHEDAGPGCSSNYIFGTSIYNDGKLQDSENALPVPTLDELINPNKAKDYASQVAEFRKMYDKSSMDYLCYEFNPPETISVRLNPWDCEEAYFEMDKVMLNTGIPEYKWDGEKFVKQ